MKLFNINFGFGKKRQAQDEYINARNKFISRWARPPTMTMHEWLDMFSKSPRLAVVDRIASDLANVGGKLYRMNFDGTEEELTNHAFLDFMANPNPLYEMTGAALWRLLEIHLMLIGEGYFVIERDDDLQPTELWIVPPHWVKMTPHLGYPCYDIISPDGATMSVSVDDMFVMKQLNPANPFMRGLGVAQSIADEVEIDEYAAKFQKKFFYNDATPPLLFNMPEASKTQRDEFMARWNQEHRGLENSHKAAAVSGNVDVKVLGSNAGKNLGFLESRLAMRDAVLEHFGVPREIMGITENSNRATADSAQYIYAKNVLTSRIKNREEAINKQLLPMFGDNLVWRYDDLIPYDKEFDKSKALDAFSAGIATKNEARELLGLPPIENGDVFLLPVNTVFLNATEDPVAASQAVLKAKTAQPSGDAVSGEKARHIGIQAMLRREDKAQEKYERLFEAAAEKIFKDEETEIAKALGTKTKADNDTPLSLLERYLTPDGRFDPKLWHTLPRPEKMRLVGIISEQLLNWQEEVKKMKDAFKPIWEEAYKEGIDIAEDCYGIPAISRPDYEAYARLNGAQRVVRINDTTKSRIAEIIANGISEGLSQVELKKMILDTMDASKKRAKLIAQQETSTALSTGQYDMMSAAGAKTKTWHHRHQKDPRDGTHHKVNHVAMEGERVKIDEKFSNGLSFPRDPSVDMPEEVIRCRCYLTYEF